MLTAENKLGNALHNVGDILRFELETPQYNAVMAILRAEASTGQPNLNALSEPFEVEVDYDDPRWQRVDASKYYEINVWPERQHADMDLLLKYHKAGKYRFTCAWTLPRSQVEASLNPERPTLDDIVTTMNNLGVHRPDWPISELAFDFHFRKDAHIHPMIAVCGTWRFHKERSYSRGELNLGHFRIGYMRGWKPSGYDHWRNHRSLRLVTGSHYRIHTPTYQCLVVLNQAVVD